MLRYDVLGGHVNLLKSPELSRRPEPITVRAWANCFAYLTLNIAISDGRASHLTAKWEAAEKLRVAKANQTVVKPLNRIFPLYVRKWDKREIGAQFRRTTSTAITSA